MAAAAVLSPTNSALPLYITPDMYPSSPILSFPPPAPAASHSIRERAGMNLRIKTNFGAPENTARSPGKIHVQPHRTNLPRRRVKSKRRTFQAFEKEQEEEKERIAGILEEVSEVVPPPRSPAQEVIGVKPEDNNHLQELIPGLWLAFSDASPEAEQPKDTEGKSWTHIVNITYPAESEPAHNGSSEQTIKDGVQRLHLTLPSSTRDQQSGRVGLGLTDSHLRTVRDFIAQALPKDVAARPDQSAIRVLITTPHGRPTDAMCAAGCYLAFASGRGVEMVLRFVDEEEDFLSIWKGEVSGEECERAEKIARSWSWLNQIKLHSSA